MHSSPIGLSFYSFPSLIGLEPFLPVSCKHNWSTTSEMLANHTLECYVSGNRPIPDKHAFVGLCKVTTLRKDWARAFKSLPWTHGSNLVCCVQRDSINKDGERRECAKHTHTQSKDFPRNQVVFFLLNGQGQDHPLWVPYCHLDAGLNRSWDTCLFGNQDA